jgi:hypothetical protein
MLRVPQPASDLRLESPLPGRAPGQVETCLTRDERQAGASQLSAVARIAAVFSGHDGTARSTQVPTEDELGLSEGQAADLDDRAPTGCRLACGQ